MSEASPTRTTSEAGPSLPGWVPLLVLGLVFVAHGSALRADWVLDDHALVRDNAVVQRGPAGIPDAFSTTAWKGEIEPGVWRPLPIVTWCLEAPLWRGENGELGAFGFHLTNLILHGLCAVLLLFLLGRLLPSRPVIAAGAAIVFAVHPMHVGTVSLVGGRADLLALLFCLVAVRLWVRRRATLLPLAGLAYFLALLSKETAVALPLILVVVEVGRAGGGVLGALAGRAAGWAFLALGFGVWLFRWPGPYAALADTVGVGVEGLGRAALGLVVPLGFGRDRLALTDGLVDLAPGPLGLVLGGLVVLVAASAIVRRGGLVATGVLAATVMFVVGAIVAPAGAPLEARFAYVTTPALFLVAGRLVESLLARPRVAGAFGGVVLLGALVGLSWHESRVWKDDGTFLDTLLERHPGRAALYLRMARRIRKDIELERAFLALQPLTPEEQETLTRDTRRALAEAEALAQAAIRNTGTGDAGGASASSAWRELGLLQLTGARPAAAVVSLREALRVDPWLVSGEAASRMTLAHAIQVAETYEALARAEESLGNVREAAAHLESALQFVPDDVSLVRKAGRSLIRAGRYGRGLQYLQRALDAATDADARRDIETEYRQAKQAAHAAASRHLGDGRRAEADGNAWDAVAAYEQALGADSTLLEAYGRLVNLRGIHFGDCRRAYAYLQRARRVMDETGVAATDSWRSKFAELERHLDEVCREDEAPGAEDDG